MLNLLSLNCCGLKSKLESLNIPVGRINKDSVKNRYGNRVLNLCKGNDLFIINGRIGNDKGIGNLTCKNSSVVDYIILSVDLFKHIVNFKYL